VLSRVPAGSASQRLGLLAHQVAVAVRTSQKRLESPIGSNDLGRIPAFPADRCQRSTQQSSRAPHRSLRVEPDGELLHDPLSPSAFGYENFPALIREMAVDQPPPVAQVQAMVLADTKALLLMRAYHIARDVAEQTPVVQLPLPRLHQAVVRNAIKM